MNMEDDIYDQPITEGILLQCNCLIIDPDIEDHRANEDDSEFDSEFKFPEKLAQYNSWVWHFGKMSFRRDPIGKI